MDFKNSTIGTLRAIPKTIILVFNDDEKVFETFGKHRFLSKEELNNKTLLEIFSKKTYLELKKLIANEISELTIFLKKHNYEVSYEKVENSNNHILYLFDITKYSKVESKLKKSMFDLTTKKEELQAVFDLAANGISILDRDGMFLYANNFFQKMMGYTMEELYSESCISLSSPEYKKPSETAVERAIKEGSVVNFRKICVSKSGEHMNASMSLSYLKSRDEILMITSDITDDIKYQEELKQQVEEEVKQRTQQYEIMCHQSRLAAMGEMIDSIAHQWRQPLNGLGLIVQGLRHISNSEGLNKEFLEEIEVEIMEKVNYMSQTIDDFSTFFRISKEKELFDVLKNTKDAIRLIDVQLKINKIETSIIVKGDASLDFIGFPNEFRQVIMNLVHNAMGAITQNRQNNRQINLIISSSKKSIKVSIMDNGGGIDEENMPKIFDPYFTTKEKGSGIGLYMSKVIIEHHMNGRLSVENYNDGAKFTLVLNRKDN